MQKQRGRQCWRDALHSRAPPPPPPPRHGRWRPLLTSGQMCAASAKQVCTSRGAECKCTRACHPLSADCTCTQPAAGTPPTHCSKPTYSEPGPGHWAWHAREADHLRCAVCGALEHCLRVARRGWWPSLCCTRVSQPVHAHLRTMCASLAAPIHAFHTHGWLAAGSKLSRPRSACGGVLSHPKSTDVDAILCSNLRPH